MCLEDCARPLRGRYTETETQLPNKPNITEKPQDPKIAGQAGREWRELEQWLMLYMLAAAALYNEMHPVLEND